MKRSGMWEKASKELKQCKYAYYDPVTDSRCAVGALVHYLLGHDACLRPTLILPAGFWNIEGALTMRDQFLANFGGGLFSLNDDSSWTFQQFADKARDLGF